MPKTAIEVVIEFYGRDPYLVLVSCILSLRTKDTVSLPASKRLFEVAKTPERMRFLKSHELERVIYPVGFYRRKAKQIQLISALLLDHYDGKVPHTMGELLSLPGVGHKTANLVLSEGFGLPGLCVDTHVHRIANRLGLVKTKTAEETEYALKALLPQELWRKCNHLLVKWGQNRCLPRSPLCS